MNYVASVMLRSLLISLSIVGAQHLIELIFGAEIMKYTPFSIALLFVLGTALTLCNEKLRKTV